MSREEKDFDTAPRLFPAGKTSRDNLGVIDHQNVAFTDKVGKVNELISTSSKVHEKNAGQHGEQSQKLQGGIRKGEQFGEVGFEFPGKGNVRQAFDNKDHAEYTEKKLHNGLIP